MNEIANGIVDLNLVWNNLAKEIEDRIVTCNNTDQRSQIIQHYLLIQLSKNRKTDAALEQSLLLIYSTGGQIRADEIAAKIGMSNRQLVRKFGNSIGLSPKEFSRIIRFIGSLNYLKSNRQSNLAEVAYSCGYYDQAHFIHDFKAYSGLTPSQFLTFDNVFY
jgi:transcriptional regulator GlxA family with amidase domain